MPAICNACGSRIDPDDINVKADTAYCRQCDTTSPYSALVHAPVASMFTAPPDGCHVELLGDRWRALASTRTWMAIPAVGFAILWNGFVGGFVFAAVFKAGAAGLVIALIASGHIAVGAYVAWQALCMVLGDVRVTVENETIVVSWGFGPIRRSKRRLLAEVRGVRAEAATGRMGPRWGSQIIVLDGPAPLQFGHLLNDERRQFLHAVLATELLSRRQPPRDLPGSATPDAPVR